MYWYLAANAVIEEPEIASWVNFALDFFRRCGYARDQYKNYTIQDDGKVCFIIPGEARYCLAPGELIVTEERRYY